MNKNRIAHGTTTECVLAFIATADRPTLQEIGDAFGVAKTVALYHVRKLAAAGKISYTPGQHRSIRIQEEQNEN